MSSERDMLPSGVSAVLELDYSSGFFGAVLPPLLSEGVVGGVLVTGLAVTLGVVWTSFGVASGSAAD